MSEEGVGITRRPSWLQTLRQHARDWGWKRAIYWQIMQPLGKRLGFHIHYVQVAADRPDLDDPVAPEIPPGYTARLGCKEDFLPALNKIPNLDQTFVDEAFEHDDECNVTFYGDELVAFSFNTRVKAPVTDQLEIVVPAGFRYGYKSWTHPITGARISPRWVDTSSGRKARVHSMSAASGMWKPTITRRLCAVTAGPASAQS